MERNEMRPGNYLSMDGDDDRFSALPALRTLEEIMRRLQWDLGLPEAPLPCKVFDVIIASGHAAPVALLVGKMYLTPLQATEAYKKLEPALSVGPTEDEDERKRNMEAFKKAFIDVLEEHGFNEHSLMMSNEQDESDAKIIICTQNAANPPSLYPIRSYPVRTARTVSCTILEAACASIASRDRFSSVTIGLGHKKVSLTNAMAKHANPTKILLVEAQRIFGDKGNVAAIISIGYGKGRVQGEPENTHAGLVVDTMENINSRCEQVHEDVLALLHKLFIYFRFNYNEISGDVADISSINARLSAYFQEDETNKHLNDAVESMRARQKGGNLLDINVVNKNEIRLKPRPSVVLNFVGREDILEAMRERHFGERSSKTRMPKITILSGLGGSGKTQIALKFAHEFEEKRPEDPVYFLDARSEDTLKADFETIIRSQGTAYGSHSCDDALAWLAAKARKWCLILDNADDPSFNLFPYIPKSAHGNVVITTRNSTQALLSPDDHHAVEGLPMADAVKLVLKMSHYDITPENEAFAQAIVKELGSLPLALAHASAYISMHQCLSTYLDAYRTSRAEFLDSDQVLPQNYQLSVATTLQMSLGKLPQLAKDMMVVFSHLEASSIPLQIISTSAERRFRAIEARSEDEALSPRTIQYADTLVATFCPDGEWFESDFNTLIQPCLEYSLLQITTQGDDRYFSMHVLVQSYLQSSLDTVRHHQPDQLVVRLLGSAITIDYKYKYQTFNRLLVPHLSVIPVERVVEAGDHAGFGHVLYQQKGMQLTTAHMERCLELRKRNIGDEHDDTLRIMSSLAMSYSEVGRYQEALDLEEKVLESRKQIPGHPDTLIGMGNLALFHSNLGRYQEALELEKEVLELRKRLLGDEHPDTLIAMANLATSYSNLGRYQEALDLVETVLALQRQISGEEHHHTLVAMGNLAMTYSQLGRHQESLDLMQQVLAFRMSILGEEHPDTLLAMTNLAACYNNLERHQESLDLGERVLEFRMRILGDVHPDTFVAMNNLSASYRELGRSQEAMDLMEKVVALHKQISGDEHPMTLRAMGNLAVIYNALGRNQESLDLTETVLAFRMSILGDEHPDTLLAMANLATSYIHLGMHQDALDLMEKVLEFRRRILGEVHPDTFVAMANLAALYSELGRYRDALDLKEKVLVLQKQNLGNEHPDTLISMGNLVTIYSNLGRYQEALDLEEKVLALRERISGDEHPNTLLAMSGLAISYNKLGRYREALDLMEKVLALRKRISGDEHPSTLLEMGNLAAIYSNLGRYQEALDLEEKVLALQERVLGTEHPNTLLAMSNLAASYNRLGRDRGALDLMEKVLALWKRVSGDEHPNTVVAMANLAAAYTKLERYQEALEIKEKVLVLQKRALGDDHSNTVLAMGNLAMSYSDLGRNQEALGLMEKVLALQKQISGDEHPNTLIAMTNLAGTYREMGRYQEALDLEEKVLALRKRISGEDHPDTLLVMTNIVATLFSLGRKDRAIALLQAAVPLHEKSLGANHPSTLMVKQLLQMLQQ